MKLSSSACQSLLTLVKKNIVAKTAQLTELSNECNFFYEKSDKAEAGTWQAFSMLNQARTKQRSAKSDMRNLAHLSKELKVSLRREQTDYTRAVSQSKTALSKEWLAKKKLAA